jgi:hypothetical protein
VSAEDALTRQLLHILQECFAADASKRPTTRDLYIRLRALQREDEASSGASQVCDMSWLMSCACVAATAIATSATLHATCTSHKWVTVSDFLIMDINKQHYQRS